MDNLIHQLKNQNILDQQTIMRLRTHIENKHADESKLIKAERLAKHINKIIDVHLHNTLNDEKLSIRTRLIELLLTKGNKRITKKHIFDQIIEQSTTEIQLHTLARKWLIHEGCSTVADTTIAKYILTTRKNEFITDEILNESHKSNTSKPHRNVSYMFIGKRFTWAVLIFLVISSVFFYITHTNKLKFANEDTAITVLDIQNSVADFKLQNKKTTFVGLPHYFKYRNISKKSLVSFLNSKNSLLSDDQYLNIILEVADEYQVNPLLLIAIAGQEQGYVPRIHQHANRIINNPYNVYGSWQKYNTNLNDSTSVVAGTIQKSLVNRPFYTDPFVYLNKTYAHDKEWWIGVKKIFKHLNEL